MEHIHHQIHPMFHFCNHMKIQKERYANFYLKLDVHLDYEELDATSITRVAVSTTQSMAITQQMDAGLLGEEGSASSYIQSYVQTLSTLEFA